jgi:hypothetical protein
MSAYTGGGSGSGDTHNPQMISGGKKVAAKKAVKKAVPAAKQVAKTVKGKASATARAMRSSAVTTPRMRGMSKTPPEM